MQRTPAQQAQAITGMSETICDLFTLCAALVFAGTASIESRTPIDPDWLITTVMDAASGARQRLIDAGMLTVF